MMKKTLTTILLGATLCTILVSGPVFAEGISNISPSVIHAELEDVSLEEALQDPRFDINHVDTNERIMPRSPYWNGWGEREYRKSDNTARPIGYSEHVSNGTVLNTFHYTRTYLDGGILGGKKGDSDRQWGYKTVQATGTYCMMDVWDTCIHKVKYGTED